MSLPLRGGLFLAETVNIAASTDGQTSFQSYTFSNPFSVVPIVMLTPNEDTVDPATIRIRNVTTTGFEVAIVEPPGSNGESAGMNNVGIFAIEAGRYVTDSGQRIEAGFHETNSTLGLSSDNWDTVNFTNNFAAAPSVITQIQTTNNETGPIPGDPSNPWITSHVNSTGVGSFQLSLDRAQTGSGNLGVNERVGYLAFEAGTGSFTDDNLNTVYWDSFTTADNIIGHDGGPVTTNYNQGNFGPGGPLLNLQIAKFDGSDGGWARYTNNTSGSVDILIDEDSDLDTERAHTTESVHVLAFSRALKETLQHEGNIEWSAGGGDSNWSTGANWNGWDGTNGGLTKGDRLYFDDTGSGDTNPTLNQSYTTQIGEIAFEESTAYTVGSSGAFTVQLEESALIVNDSSAAQTLSIDIVANGVQMGIDAGTTAGGSFIFDSSSSIDLSDTNGVALYVTGSNNTTIAGDVTGLNGAIVKEEAGTLTLTGMNTFSGGTTLTGGTLIGDTDSLPTDITNNAMLNFDQDANGTYSNIISGTGTVEMSGTATLTLTGNNTYSGATTISSGKLAINADNRLGTSPGSPTANHLVINGGTLQGTGTFTIDSDRGIQFGASNATVEVDAAQTVTYAGTATGTGTLTKTGSGTLDLTGVSSYTGKTTVTAGTLGIDSDSSLGAAPGVATAGHLDLNGGTLNTKADFTLSANRGISLSANSTIDTDTGTMVTYNGVVAGTGTFDKNGAGTLVLGGSSANTNTGTVTINAGVLEMNKAAGTNAFTSNISLDGGTLRYQQDNQLADTIDLTFNGGELDMNGHQEGSETVVGINQLIIDANSTLSFGSVSMLRVEDVIRNGGELLVANWVGDPVNGSTAGIMDLFLSNTDISGDAALLSNIKFLGWGNVSAKAFDPDMDGIWEIAPDANPVFQWDQDVSGNWNVDPNWSGVGIPDAVGQITQFLDITANRTVTLTTNRTVGTMAILEDSNDYTITSQTIIMDFGAANASLSAVGAGSHTIASDIDLNSSLEVVQKSTGTMTISGVIDDPGADYELIKKGSGVLALTATNTYEGKTTIEEGTLRITADLNLGADPGVATAGHITMDGGKLNTGATFTLDSDRGIQLNVGGGGIETDAATVLTYGGVIAGTGGLTKSGAGKLVLTGTNTYSGPTSVDGGTLEIGGDDQLGAAPGAAQPGHLVLDNGTLEVNATMTLNSNRGLRMASGHGTLDINAGQTLTYNGVVDGTGNLTKTDAGTLILGGTNTYTGSTSINGGTLQISADTNLGLAPGAPTAGHLNLNGGTLNVTASTTLNSNRGGVFGAGGATLDVDAGQTLIWDGIVTGTGALTVNDTGTLQLGGNSTYSGGTNLTGGGTLIVGNNNALGSGAVTVTAASTLEATAATPNIGNNFTLNANLTVGGSNNLTMSGVVSGANNLVKTGSSKLILQGANTYTGTTTISAGELELGGTNGDVGTGSVTGAAGTKLIVNRTGTADIEGTITVPTVEIINGTLRANQDVTVSTEFEVGAGGTFEADANLTLDISNATLDADDGGISVTAGNNLTIELPGLPTPSVAYTANTMYYDFDNTTGAINVDDANAYDGTAIGSLPTFDTTDFARGTSSGRFNGTQGMKPGAPDTLYNDAESLFSVAYWVKVDSTAGTNYMWSEGGTTNGVEIWADTTNVHARIKNSGGTPSASILATNAITANDWLHVALVYDASDIRLYLDGTLFDTQTFTATLSAHGNDPGMGNVTGHPFSGGASALVGNIDEYYYFDDYVLTAGEIAELAAETADSEFGDVNLAAGSTLTLNSSTNAANFDQITTQGTTTINGTAKLGSTIFDTDSGSTLTVNNVVTGSDVLTKNDDGTLVLAGTTANDYSGNTLVNGGILALDKTAGVDAIAGGTITVEAGATLQLRDNNQIDDTANLILNGGTFDVRGYDETLNNLTLTANSVIDMGDIDSTLLFTGTVSGIGTGVGEYTLDIWDWSENPFGGGGPDSLIFSGTTLDADALSQIRFFKDDGLTQWPMQTGQFGGALAPIPEPSTWFAGTALLGLVGWHRWTSLRRRRAGKQTEVV